MARELVSRNSFRGTWLRSARRAGRLLRIKSQIFAHRPGQHRVSAIDCLTETLAVTRERSALALELRSTTAMARLLVEGGQSHEARRVLTLADGPFHGRI
jgi:hypothetical protein